MRYRAALHLPAVTAVLLITWGISSNSFDIRGKARNILGFSSVDQIKAKLKTALSSTKAPEAKCNLSRVCPPSHFALHVMSGAANVVGPKICFEGKIIMSHILNNVGPGLNIVVINGGGESFNCFTTTGRSPPADEDCVITFPNLENLGENGVVEKSGYLNMQDGNPGDIVAYLKGIKRGMIVLVASFDDVTPKLTDEMREVLAGMGSTLIKSVNARDSWVFVGRVGSEDKSLYEKQAVNDEKTNIYEEWPELVEVAGCFPRS